MSQENEISSESLVAIVTCALSTDPALFKAACAELLHRMTNTSKPSDDIHYHIKDLHERIDQNNKKLMELADRIGNAHRTEGTEETRFKIPPSSVSVSYLGSKESLTAKSLSFPNEDEFAKDCRVTVPSGWVIVKDGKEINWSDEAMRDFAGLCQTEENRSVSTTKMLEKYKELVK